MKEFKGIKKRDRENKAKKMWLRKLKKRKLEALRLKHKQETRGWKTQNKTKREREKIRIMSAQEWKGKREKENKS